MSVSHVSGSVVSVPGASTVQCNAVLRANRCALGWLVWWVEWLKRSLSASGVAGWAFGVNVWTLSVVPVVFHCATHHLCWWHISVTVGVSGGLSLKAAQSDFRTFGLPVVLFRWTGQGHQMVHKVRRQGVLCALYSVLTRRGLAHGNVPRVCGGRQGVDCHGDDIVRQALHHEVLFPRQGGRRFGCVFHCEV